MESSDQIINDILSIVEDLPQLDQGVHYTVEAENVLLHDTLRGESYETTARKLIAFHIDEHWIDGIKICNAYTLVDIRR